MFHNIMYSLFQVPTFIFLPIIAPYVPTTLSYAVLFVALTPALTSALASLTHSQTTTSQHSLSLEEDDLVTVDYEDEPENN